MSGGTRNVVLLVVLVVALGFAGWFFYRGDPEGVIPDDPNVLTHWMCEKCGWRADLTERDLDKWSHDRQKRWIDPDDKFNTQLVFWCPQCQEFTVVGAMQCPIHNIWHCAISSKGQVLDCPECEKEREAGGG